MQLSKLVLLLAAGVSQAVADWSIHDASITVSAKKGADNLKEKLDSPLTNPVQIGNGDSFKIILTAKDDGKAKRPHQAFVHLYSTKTDLSAPFPMTVKENGKAMVQIAYKDVPLQLLALKEPIAANIFLASFGESSGVNLPKFTINFVQDPNSPPPEVEAPVRYQKQPEIHHIFRPDPKSPPKVVSLFFAAAVAATVPALFIGWTMLGVNLNHLQKALGAAPLSHATFFGSILAMEGVFFLYYGGWNLFKVLPLVGVVGFTTFISGTKALGEVQSRRLAGER
ncbi:hypothetical protein MCOR29_006792 [Pyricularia oryzae]|nr:hypothetical protein MCOR19_007734 [Pyricularia oryzae]KAI6316015.1 hypothetical protein MCOR29_006792 [Pyricularia oryzae]KAI6319855.1 hypothetical protein MCOR30_008496 [Pyricularia oryzae]KAI6370018.1 hypothetical protein MCOR31_004821 [Pyricularia oryzae]KAI6401029.1 hypothetical protein MCOR20_008242 [Pyricularia oryzae]